MIYSRQTGQLTRSGKQGKYSCKNIAPGEGPAKHSSLFISKLFARMADYELAGPRTCELCLDPYHPMLPFTN
jgi:hypothetical protein